MVQDVTELTLGDRNHSNCGRLEHWNNWNCWNALQSKLCSFALANKLPIVKILQFSQRRDLINVLIVPDPFDSGKAQSELGTVLWTMLDLIIRYLDDDFRFDADRIAIISDL